MPNSRSCVNSFNIVLSHYPESGLFNVLIKDWGLP